jgi:O-methyltransferase
MKDEEILEFVQPYTLCSAERIENLLYLVEKVIQLGIPGDFVEIGVYKGGMLMAMALKCQQMGVERRIYGYDTFTGMTEPTKYDYNNQFIFAKEIMDDEGLLYDPTVLCISSLEDTKRNIETTNYSCFTLVQGDICQTKKEEIPKQIAILRLDTDWYESTKFELEHFEPNVVQDGFVILDDYGHWLGCRKAVEEFWKKTPYAPLRIDYTSIFWQKTKKEIEDGHSH